MTAAIKPYPPPAAFTMPDLYPLHEQSDGRVPLRYRRASAGRMMMPQGPPAQYPMYAGLQTTSRFQDTSPAGFHTTLKRPQKLAGGGNSSAFASPLSSSSSPSPSTSPSPLPSYDPREVRLRAASFGSTASYDSYEPNTWIRHPHHHVYQPSPTRARFRPERRINELFDLLPDGVLELIMQSLKRSHLAKESKSCATCWMRDVSSISLCKKRWYRIARAALYEDIQLIGPDSATHKKKSKQAQGNRIALLRRTLRSNPDIASLVRSVKVPCPEPPVNWSVSKGGMSWLEHYEDRVAALVMACPNLERLTGPTSSYSHLFKKIFHALSTRRQLKEMIWVLDPASRPPPLPLRNEPTQQRQSIPEVLNPQEEETFIDHHRNWSSLTNLSVMCQPGATLAPTTLLSRTLACLPSIQHLHLCNISPSAFNDDNLLSLPPLQSLIFSHVTGITSDGLSSFATRQNSASLQRLELRHTPLTSLPALARIFSHLAALRSFTLVQTSAPVMPESDVFTFWMMPYLASSTLAKLHWDIISNNDNNSNTADDILIRSIDAGGFPSLTTLRSPNDPDGRFQALCRPVEQICLPGDRFSSGTSSTSSISLPSTTHSYNSSNSYNSNSSSTTSAPSSPISLVHKSSTTLSLTSSFSSSLSSFPITGSDLQKARIAAQSRLDAARGSPRFTVHVTDHDGSLADSFSLAGYIGTQGSSIAYHLLPDEGAADDHGGLLDVMDLVADQGETIDRRSEGCTGRWNWQEGTMADRREKERWWHTERGRWRRVEFV